MKQEITMGSLFSGSGGFELPEILRQALIRQAQLMSSAMTSATGAE